MPLPVRVQAASGDVLEVSGDLAAGAATAVTLCGPAVYVFHGNLSYGETPASDPNAG
jgi:hypothetical protein